MKRLLPVCISSAAAAAIIFASCAPAQDMGAVQGDDPPNNAIWVESLDLRQMSQDYMSARAQQSVDRNPIKLAGTLYPHGIGTHANSEMSIDLKGAATRFVSVVGVDDEKSGHGSVDFEVWVDKKKLADSGVLHGGDQPKFLSVDLTGAKKMTLRVTDGGDGIDSDHADWAGAAIVLTTAGSPKPTAAAVEVTPPPNIIFAESGAPSIHGPRVVGTTPGRPFLFMIPASGQKPLRFAAKNLPDGLSLDPNTGIISGTVQPSQSYDLYLMGPGNYAMQPRGGAGSRVVDVSVSGPTGSAHRQLTIVAGIRKLAQTPPMGWNSWNVWAGAVDDAKVREAADAMVSSGLAAHGFNYINIDDTWEGPRGADGIITTNKKFPDMKALCDYVHSKGLKLGIYSSPGPTTCASFPASYRHEQQDADTYSKWGVDYLKYDWCSYSGIADREKAPQLEKFEKPYIVMRDALDNTSRDIVYSLCQYGMGSSWEWAAQPSVGGNCWRTTGDINDSWSSLQSIAFSQNGHEKFAGPGHWNDPDMLIVGRVGWGNPHPSRLTPNEQVLHISMWALQSAPLLIGCDMPRLDPFTLALLTNDEVLDVNQDPLGRPAGRLAQDGTMDVWGRTLWDGSRAVGLFNRGSEVANVTAHWKDLGISGSQTVRDLWQHKNMGRFADAYTASVPPHGCVMVRIGAERMAP